MKADIEFVCVVVDCVGTWYRLVCRVDRVLCCVQHKGSCQTWKAVQNAYPRGGDYHNPLVLWYTISSCVDVIYDA